MPSRRRQSLPPVSPKVSNDLKPMVAAIKEIIETGEGVRGDPLDRKITLRDLVDSGIGQLRNGVSANMAGALIPTVAPRNRAIPPKPDGFNVSGGFNGRIDLTWTIPGVLYGNHAYTNVYRSETDNFANAILVGREAGSFYTDDVRADTEPKIYYYWITFTSESGIDGPTNATSGTAGQALVDVAYLLETLTDNLADAPATLGASDQTLILHAERFAIRTGPAGAVTYPLVIASVNGTPTVVLDTAIIRDGTIQEGQLGPITFGKLEAADGTPITTVGGLLKADYIDVDNLSVAEAATFFGDAQSGSYGTGVSGWRLLQTGNAEFNDITARGHIEMDTGYIADGVSIGGLGSFAYKGSLFYSEVTGTKPPTDADNTGSNTAANTNAVAGTAATTVRDNAAMGNSAKSVTNNWTRPGQTLIDGNKIFTGDAYVDTAQIAGNAITLLQAQSGGSYTGSSGWTNLIDFTYYTGVVSGNIDVLVNWGGIITGGKNGGDFFTPTYARLRIVIGGSGGTTVTADGTSQRVGVGMAQKYSFGNAGVRIRVQYYGEITNTNSGGINPQARHAYASVVGVKR